MKDIFCAKEQKITPHRGSVDLNGEFVFTCSTKDCGTFLKYPADTTADKLNELIAAEEEQNKGQVSIEAQEETLKKLLAADEGKADSKKAD